MLPVSWPSEPRCANSTRRGAVIWSLKQHVCGDGPCTEPRPRPAAANQRQVFPNSESSEPMSHTCSLLRSSVAAGASHDGGPLIVGERVSTCPSAKHTLAMPPWRKWTLGNFCDGDDRYLFSVSLSNGAAKGTLAESAKAIVADV